MDTMLLRLFQQQIRDQCRFLLFSVQNLQRSLDVLQDHDPDSTKLAQAQDAVWFSLQNLLNAAANISKALWGSGGRLVEERRPLRESLGVPDNSPLQTTDIRNHFEHYDERLERWHRQSASHIYIDRSLGPPGMIQGDAIGELDWFRHFNPATGIATFWGDTYDLKEIIAATEDLLCIAAHESARPFWEDGPTP